MQTEYGRWRDHSETAMEVPRTMAGRLLRPVNGVNNVTTWRGDVTVGTIPANGASELNQNQVRHRKMWSSKDTRMDQPKASSSKWAAARALHLRMQKYYPLR